MQEAILNQLGELRLAIDAIERLVRADLAPEPKSASPRTRPFYGVSPEDVGFHVLKDEWKQPTFIQEQCARLLERGVLESTLVRTRALAPRRTAQQGFFIDDLNRTPIEEITEGTEREMEAKLFEQMHLARERAVVDGIWAGLLGRQVPLFDARTRNGWGHIDLLAIDAACRPQVVELKLFRPARNNDSPQRPLFEGVAYAVALGEVWDAFRGDFEGWLGEHREVPNFVEPPTIGVVLLAPHEYWNHWLAHPCFQRGRGEYCDLVAALGAAGVPVQFSGFDKALAVRSRNDFVSP